MQRRDPAVPENGVGAGKRNRKDEVEKTDTGAGCPGVSFVQEKPALSQRKRGNNMVYVADSTVFCRGALLYNYLVQRKVFILVV